MAISGPDVAGFLEAQDRLRETLGQDVDFMVRVPPEWPEDTPVDTAGVPYDPTIKPTSGGDLTAVTKHVSVIVKSLSLMRLRTDVSWSPGGEMTGGDAVIDLNVDDYDDVKTAVQVWMDTLKFKITEWKPSGLGGVRRWWVFLEEM